MKKIIILLVMMALAVLSSPIFGGDYITVTSPELKAMIDSGEPGLVIIDSRLKSQFDDSHIKGAISIPLGEMEQNPALPITPKSAKLIFYCSGNTWRGSIDAARVAVQRGYTQVLVLKGGLPGWQKAGYPVETIVKK